MGSPPRPPAARRPMPASLPAFVHHRWFRRALVVAILAAGGAFALRTMLFGTVVEVYEVHRGDLVQTVVATGRVITPQRVAVGSVITERVARIPVAEGQTVKRGDVLIELDDKDEQAALVQAEADRRAVRGEDRAAARPGLARRGAGARAGARPTASWRTCSSSATRISPRRASSRSRRSTMPAATWTSPTASRRRRSSQVESSRQGGSDYRVAETALAQAQAAVRVARAKLGDTVIRAPADGVLIAPQRRARRRGPARQGAAWCSPPPARRRSSSRSTRRTCRELAVGQKALVSADAYPGERFAGELFYINPGRRPAARLGRGEARVPQPPAYLRQDMTVSVDIDVGAAQRTSWSRPPTRSSTPARRSRGCCSAQRPRAEDSR